MSGTGMVRQQFFGIVKTMIRGQGSVLCYIGFKEREKTIMIRTNVVTLSVIPAIAYREKIKDGGTSLVVLRKGETQPGIAGISKKTGEAIPTKNTNTKKYPKKAFDEAIRLTNGMSFKKQGAVKITDDMFKKEKVKKEEVVVVDEADYQAIAARYIDKNGNFSYDLINKDFIRFAHSSSIVRTMIDERKPVKAIRKYIVGNKFRNLCGNDDLTDKQVDLIVSRLDELSPKSIFKDLDEYLRKELSAAKKR